MGLVCTAASDNVAVTALEFPDGVLAWAIAVNMPQLPVSLGSVKGVLQAMQMELTVTPGAGCLSLYRLSLDNLWYTKYPARWTAD